MQVAANRCVHGSAVVGYSHDHTYRAFTNIKQGEVNPALIATVLTVLVAPLYNWLLIFKSDLGLTGAALAYDAAFLTNFVLLLGYVIYRDIRKRGTPEQSWHGLYVDMTLCCC